MNLLDSRSLNLLLYGYLYLVSIVLCQVFALQDDDGFIRGECPRAEDIHPCTCEIHPKFIEDEHDESASESQVVEDASHDTESTKRRLTRSAILTATNAPSPEVATSSSLSSSSSSPTDQKVLLNLRLDIGSSLAALFTTPSTFSTIFTTSSPYFVSQFDAEPQTVQPTEPIAPADDYAPNSSSSSASSSTNSAFSPSDSIATGDGGDEEVSPLGSEVASAEIPTTKSPSDINQAPLVDFTTVLSVLSNSPNLQSNLYSNSPSSKNSASLNLELATSHRETSINKMNLLPHLQQNKLSQVNFTKETAETSTNGNNSLLPTMATIKRQIVTSASSSSPSVFSQSNSVTPPPTTTTTSTANGIVVTSQSTYQPQQQQQLRGQVLQGEIASQSAQVNESSAIAAPAVPNLPSWATKNESISSSHGSNLGSMDTATRDNKTTTKPLTKMATSDPGTASQKGYNEQKQQQQLSTLLPIALILSNGSGNNGSEPTSGVVVNSDGNNQIGDNKQASRSNLIQQQQQGQGERVTSNSRRSGATFNGGTITTVTTPAKDHQAPKLPASVAAVEIITTEIIDSSLDEQTSAPTTGTLTASNYEPGKSSDTQSSLNQPLGPSDDSSSGGSSSFTNLNSVKSNKLKLTPALVESTTTITSTVDVPSSGSSTGTTTAPTTTSTTSTTVKPAQLPTALAHSRTKKPSNINDANFATSDDEPGVSGPASLLVINSKTSPNGPLGSPDIIPDSYDFKPVREDESVNAKKNDSATASPPHLQFKSPAPNGVAPAASPPPSIPPPPPPSSSSSSPSADESSHFSLRGNLVVCKNVKSARVMADVLRNMKELLQVSSLQFNDNFSDKSRDYFYGRSSKGVKLNSSSSPTSSSSSSPSLNRVKSEPSQGFASSTHSWWKK